jgi:hypothetical protein
MIAQAASFVASCEIPASSAAQANVRMGFSIVTSYLPGCGRKSRCRSYS